MLIVCALVVCYVKGEATEGKQPWQVVSTFCNKQVPILLLVLQVTINAHFAGEGEVQKRVGNVSETS